MREMKDSGLSWIGEVPKTWATETGKHFLIELKRPVKEDDGVITCFRNGEVTLRSKRREEGFTISVQEVGYQGIEPGDLVVHGMDGFAGAIGISDSRGKATPVLTVMDTNQSKQYLTYYLRNMAFNGVFLALSTGIRVRSCDTSWKKIRSLSYVLPPLEEQSRIAAYLDRRCATIDALIANQQQQIDKLKQYKQAVITEAVTRGLDPSEEAVFDFVRLKFIATHIIDCPHETPEYSFDGRYYVIRTADQDYASLRSDDNMYRLSDSEYQNRIRRMSLDANDIVYGREGERWGLASIVPTSGKYCLGQRMMQIRCDEEKVLPKYCMYALSSILTRQQGELDTIGSTSPHVNISTIRNFALRIPSIERQTQITTFLDTKCAQIDALIALKQQKADKLAQYKKSLIYEVVTGKREI